MPVLQLLQSFNAGELSPRLDARVGIEKYQAGCRVLQNFIVTPYGGIDRRPGTVYMGAAKEADSQCRLIPFQFSTTTSFVLEFGDEYIRFWSNDIQVEVSSPAAWVTATAYVAGDFVSNGGSNYYCILAHTSGASTEPGVGASWATNWVLQDAYEVPSPYAAADLFGIQYIQINDVVYLAHGDYAPRKLSRLGDADWTLEEIIFDWPALKDENVTATTIASSATSGAVTLTASTDTFNASHVGSYWQLAHIREGAFTEKVSASNGNSASLRVLGSWEFFTYGTWDAEAIIERTYDGGGTWEVLNTYRSDDDANFIDDGFEDKVALIRIRIKNSAAAGTNARFMIQAADSRTYGLVRIDTFTNATSVDGTVVLAEIGSTAATTYWSEGAWNGSAGYPAAVTFHEQRVIYGGTQDQATTFWGSVTGDFENFRRQNRDDSSFAFQLASTQNNKIQWMASQGNLIIGSTGEEWVIGASGEAGVITPTNVEAKLNSTWGSKAIQPEIVNEAMVFVQRLGRKVREFVYSFEPDRFVAPDLTLLSEHITTQGGLTQIALQRQPDTILWGVTASGTLVGMTYERQQNVVGWARHVTDGEVESATVIFDDGHDQLWLAVKRTIDGNTVRYIERMDPEYRNTQDNEDQDDLIYSDCAKVVTLSPADTAVTGLDHLEGETVKVLADGAVVSDKVVTSGAITLPEAAEKVIVGMGYTSIAKPMRLELQLPDGTAQGRHTKVHEVALRLLRSLGGMFAQKETDTFDQINFRDTSDAMDAPPPLFTGDKELSIEGSWDNKGGELVIKQTEPLPMTILAIVIKFDVLGK